jgi:hypothetical protein
VNILEKMIAWFSSNTPKEVSLHAEKKGDSRTQKEIKKLLRDAEHSRKTLDRLRLELSDIEKRAATGDWTAKAELAGKVGEDLRKRIAYSTSSREKSLLEVSQLELKLEELGEKFKCHVCGTSASIPASSSYKTGNDDGYNTYDYVSYDNWSAPGDLRGCSICSNWTCLNHIHEGICKECAEKL